MNIDRIIDLAELVLQVVGVVFAGIDLYITVRRDKSRDK